MNNKERANHWLNQVAQWRASGLSGAQFCKDHELNVKHFYYWSREHSNKPVIASDDKMPSLGFATVVMADTLVTDLGLRVTLPNGCAIEGITSGNVSLVDVILAQL
jgi:hypothetical protein